MIDLPNSVTEYATGCLAMGSGCIWVDQHINEGAILQLNATNGRAIRAIPKPNPRGTVLYGLKHVYPGRLMYYFKRQYENAETLEKSWGYLKLDDLTVQGPYAAPNHTPAACRLMATWTNRGWVWGGGGYHNRAPEIGASWGPALARDDQRLLYYPEDRRCIRPDNVAVPGDWVGRVRGEWTAGDWIGGPTGAPGVMYRPANKTVTFFVSLATGHVEYRQSATESGVYAGGREYYTYEYDIEDFEQPVPPWTHVPRITPSPHGDIRGVAQYMGHWYGFQAGPKPKIVRLV